MSGLTQVSNSKLYLASSNFQGFSKGQKYVKNNVRRNPRFTSLTVRAAAEGKDSNSLRNIASKMGKKITGNKEYEFGDITKNAVEMATEAIEDVGKLVDEDYKVGDLSKKVVNTVRKDTKKLSDAADAAGQVITEDEEYKFGDFTKGVFGKAKKAVNKLTKEKQENPEL
uniref:Uncharacterized protein n=1 Tax=Polyblepharides amylifera TaxID=1486889 RepID=A0A7R9XM92_9CHLO|mmetsp:Transcript_784/g.1131  ORF Transcript_784/g.1131 Transcript_784/m.1131 type:complete len:169 (+) Transcript_784:122-628(+)|eukprot:CAMPEP_0196570780 /NCGR_PEP_ID=MMETSP1081-20130531/953_1 /TAXON_ID=36882 /ORGANISM="Pyramimonas amylifera, Strain CCMP720" /LENGTH=168 /DNA_ID=CAMNT_0041887427 /DNA_START=120 /DNA_END=626 /DNA_ORIENTATION=+